MVFKVALYKNDIFSSKFVLINFYFIIIFLIGMFSYLKHYWSVVIKLSKYPIDKQLRTAHLFLSSLIQARVFVYKTN
jgi:hypothetical protein